MSNVSGSTPRVHLSLFCLRVFSGLALIYYQGWEQFHQGWNYLWKSTRWRLLDHFSVGHPVPVAVVFAFVTAGFFFVSPVLLVVGFLTRVNALLIFLGLLLTLDKGLNEVLSTSLHTQTMVLYLLIMFFYFVNGGGLLAADRLFDQRRGKNKL
jgi:uncharacterized membrane protein YphA (DoxX/SURF4 family)